MSHCKFSRVQKGNSVQNYIMLCSCTIPRMKETALKIKLCQLSITEDSYVESIKNSKI